MFRKKANVTMRIAVCMWLTLLGIYTAEAELQTITITYTTCRFFNTYRPYSNVEYSLIWPGKDLVETESCDIRFKPFDEDHKICIESESFQLEDSNIKMISYDGKYANHVRKTYTYNDNYVKLCGIVDSYVGIKLIIPSSNGTRDTKNSVRLRVTVVYHFNILNHLNLISGIASAIFVWLPWIVAIYILCRRVRMKVLQSPYSRLRSTNNDATSCSDSEECRNPGHVISRPSEDDNPRRQIARTDVVVHT